MLIRSRIVNIDGWEIEINSYNQPDPHVAAQAILPLVLEVWHSQGDKNEQELKQQEAA